MRIRVVEDELKLAKALGEGLEADHYSVTVAYTGEDGFYLARAERFDVLDIMLSGRDGFDILATLRQREAPRISALVRRGATESTAGLKIGDLQMDIVGRSVTRSGEALDLTAREFDILEYLLIHQGRVVSREMLGRGLWKEVRHTPLDNAIDVHGARLRRKVDDCFENKLVHTVRGVAFVVREDAV